MIAGTKVRWGILGCARIARRGLIPGILASQGGSLHALASRNLTTAATWAQEFKVPKAYGTYHELVTDADVGAVYIPLPNELHKPWVIAAADAGKHVLCEKPLTLDAREAAEIADHCRGRGVILMEAFMWRHQPRTLALRTLVREGAIGSLRLIRSSFSFPIEPGDWRLDPARGGGLVGRGMLRREHCPFLRGNRTDEMPCHRPSWQNRRGFDAGGITRICERRRGGDRLQL